MKNNRFQQQMNQGKVPLGHMLMEFNTSGIAKILETADLDFVLIDMEHNGFDVAKIADLIAWFKATPIAPIVRVPGVDIQLIHRLMDCGLMGIIVPDVTVPDEIQSVVNAAKYPPLGKRSVTIGVANTDYRILNRDEYLRHANQNTTIISQIESREGLDNLDEIAAVPGVDVLWVGHNDLSESLGVPGDFNHPTFIDAVKGVVGTARKHGLGVGVQPRNGAMAQEWIDMGFNVISCSADIFLYQRALSELVEDIRGMQA